MSDDKPVTSAEFKNLFDAVIHITVQLERISMFHSEVLLHLINGRTNDLAATPEMKTHFMKVVDFSFFDTIAKARGNDSIDDFVKVLAAHAGRGNEDAKVGLHDVECETRVRDKMSELIESTWPTKGSVAEDPMQS